MLAMEDVEEDILFDRTGKLKGAPSCYCAWLLNYKIIG